MKREGEAFARLVEEVGGIGRILFEAGLNNTHSGNLSIRLGDRVLITRRGSMLGCLTEADLIDVGLREDDSGIALASTEVNVHRAVYSATSHLSIVHSHPKTAIAMSMNREFIVPVDDEGRYYFKRIPVLSARETIGSLELEERLPVLLKDFPIVMVRGHGAFAAGGSLEEGLQYTHSLEWSCEILMRCLVLGMSEKELLGGRTHGEW
jgi:L-fuculose-phosphate aldolase